MGNLKKIDDNISEEANDTVFQKGLSHAFDILRNMKFRPGEKFMDGMKRMLQEGTAEIKKRSELERRNALAQKKFDELNHKNKLNG